MSETPHHSPPRGWAATRRVDADASGELLGISELFGIESSRATGDSFGRSADGTGRIVHRRYRLIAQLGGGAGDDGAGVSQEERHRRLRDMLDRTLPEQWAAYGQYHRAMEARRAQMGLLR